MAFALPAWQPPGVPIEGDDRAFPVRRIYCVGRNYAAHAREMGGDPDREPPFFFTKPADALVTAPTMPYPPATTELHHEVELVVAIGTGGRDIGAEQALNHVFGYAVGLDMTRRDLQAVLRKAGRPWDMAKGFDHSAPCGALRPAAAGFDPRHGAITLKVNGTPRQGGDLADMVWSVPEIIACLSGLVTLAPGDLIYTGTPDGVAAVEAGDRLEARIDGLPPLMVTIV